MGAGGIVNDEADVLLTAVNASVFNSQLSPEDRKLVGAIKAKAPKDRTQSDVTYLAELLASTANK